METAIHKTFEKSEDGREAILRVSDGREVQKITPKKLDDWMKGLGEPRTLRFTAVHAQDPIINALVSQGHHIIYANWHKTGIEKNLDADEIVKQFALLPSSAFRSFVSRPDLSELRFRVSQRLAIMEYRKAATLKLKGAGRLFGQVNEEDYSEEVKELLSEAEKIDIRVDVNGKMVSLDTVIAKLAKNIPECVLFNGAAYITGAYNTAAAIVAFSGGIDRFDNVASFWHYCGQDPTSNKRKKGQPVSYSPKIKTILWQMSESIVKNRSNPWRDFYDAEFAKEFAIHQTKLHLRTGKLGCETPKGHSMNMAKTKMRKEILKRFFLSVKGEEYR